MSETPSTTPSGARLRSTPVLATLAVAVVAAGALAGIPIGSKLASSAEDRDRDAARRASDQEDVARDRRDLLDARVQLIDEQTAPLPDVGTKPPLLASGKTSTNTTFGTEFEVDGGRYTVHGYKVVNSSSRSRRTDRPTR